MLKSSVSEGFLTISSTTAQLRDDIWVILRNRVPLSSFLCYPTSSNYLAFIISVIFLQRLCSPE